MWIAALLLGSGPDQMSLKFVASGVSKTLGYVPVRAALGDDASGVKKAPKDLAAPRYGWIELGTKKLAFVIDQSETASILFIDSNGDGDLTNDPAPKWEAQKQGDFTMYKGTAEVVLGKEKASIGVYRFDPKDPQRAQLKDTVLWYTDYGYEGTAIIGKETYSVLVAGEIAPSSRLWFDRNANGKRDGRSEMVAANQLFNFGGTTYKLKPGKGTYLIEESSEVVAEIPLPPDLSVGKPVPTFEATATDGTKITFPGSYKGKVVMLDFWATWCGPCIGELPNLTKAYEKYHEKGFEVLGVSFDKENMAEKLAEFTKERNMPWRQVYEGKFWSTTLGAQFGVEAIPFALLVDGETGKIIANVNKLRGENLDKTLESVFASKNNAGRQ